ncbi:PaaI family thioesterase [Pseudooceanicola sp.]|jgi:acyl-coenzyme A thioesterase PaaI-like protein|uniref:PaaI family thioesterase n=1 Tax=Pseudooceanicola sp. TaxID=1914328 RepID=UPI00405A183C
MTATTRAGFDPAAQGWRRRESRRFPATIGTVWERDIDGAPCLGMICEPGHDNGNGAMHGGIVSTLCDIGLGYAVSRVRNAVPGQPRVQSATIQLNVSFSGAILQGQFVESRARIGRATRSLTFASGELVVEDAVVATMQGVFKLVPIRAPA